MKSLGERVEFFEGLVLVLTPFAGHFGINNGVLVDYSFAVLHWRTGLDCR